ncbi:hypothetical protein [Vibrio cortegadensis]|uniref:hypothetical protein n=1 Tax=Vibrio cortegadensis TaxID=1328770 RepID=UPI0021C485D1|nr:hypothetical protein [Vibrio cortegadensis]
MGIDIGTLRILSALPSHSIISPKFLGASLKVFVTDQCCCVALQTLLLVGVSLRRFVKSAANLTWHHPGGEGGCSLDAEWVPSFVAVPHRQFADHLA